MAAVDPNTTPAATPHLSHATDLNTSSNYRYDPLGQLTHDSREGIENIDWTVAGKVNSVTYTNTSPRDPLFFTYGAGGHRIQKQVGSAPNTGVGYREHNIRDAQGNIMAIYRYSNVPNAGVSLKVKERPLPRMFPDRCRGSAIRGLVRPRRLSSALSTPTSSRGTKSAQPHLQTSAFPHPSPLLLRTSPPDRAGGLAVLREPPAGFEPATCSLRMSCSTAELGRRYPPVCPAGRKCRDRHDTPKYHPARRKVRAL